MKTAIFFQSELKDPYAFYESMLKENPVCRDDGKKCWVIYSHAGCKSILSNPFTYIPSVSPKNAGTSLAELFVKSQISNIYENN